MAFFFSTKEKCMKRLLIFIFFTFFSFAISNRDLIIDEFANKRIDANYELSAVAKKAFDLAKQIILFPQGTDPQKVILSHPEDIHFLTSTPHFIHRHILVCTFLHDNDIRLKYDPTNDDFFFHTKDSVRLKRKMAQEDPSIVYELDYFALRQKKKIADASSDHPNYIILQNPTTLHNTFKRKGDGNFYLEIVTGSREDKPTASGNHNWIRLIDNLGNVLSVGCHPRHSIFGYNAYQKMPVMFYNSDVYEWVDNRTYFTYTFPITHDEYFKVKDDIIKDMVAITNPNTAFDYSTFEMNCADWVINKISFLFSLNVSEMKSDAYATFFPDWHKYYIYEMSDDMKWYVDPILRMVQYGLHIPRLIKAAFSGAFTKNDQNANSSCFFYKPISFFLDVDMHVAVHPYLLKVYFERHEKELLEQRLKAINE